MCEYDRLVSSTTQIIIPIQYMVLDALSHFANLIVKNSRDRPKNNFYHLIQTDACGIEQRKLAEKAGFWNIHSCFL